MQNIFIIGVVVFLAIGGYFVYSSNFKNIDSEVANSQAEVSSDQDQVADSSDDDSSALENGPSVNPISHASMVLTWAGQTIYVDPVGEPSLYTDQLAPDLVLITDIHGDHLSTETLSGVISPDSLLIVPQAVFDELTEDLQAQATVIGNGETTDVLGFSVEAVPMYNFPETDDARHIKGRGNGYIVEVDGFRTLIAGDTGPSPELKAMADIDLAFVPMNLPYTMSVEEAAAAVVEMSPKTAVPYHYRNQGGELSDVEDFKAIVQQGNSNIKVLLLNWYPDQEVDNEEDDTAEPAGEVKVFEVSGTNFAFDVKEIKVNEGDTVTINFVSANGFHDWVVDEFSAATEQVRPGTPTSVTFVADKSGTYEYYCSVGNHRAQGMVGTLIVE